MLANQMYQLERGLSEAAFKECAERGQKIIVHCDKDAVPERGNFRGEWKLFALNPDTGKWASLNLSRLKNGVHSPRVLHTVDGVCRVLIDLGFPVGFVPYKAGTSVEASKSGEFHFFSSVGFD